MADHHNPVLRHLDIQFNAVGPDIDGCLKGRQGILGCRGTVAPVTGDAGPAEGIELLCGSAQRRQLPESDGGESRGTGDAERHQKDQQLPAGRIALLLRRHFQGREGADIGLLVQHQEQGAGGQGAERLQHEGESRKQDGLLGGADGGQQLRAVPSDQERRSHTERAVTKHDETETDGNAGIVAEEHPGIGQEMLPHAADAFSGGLRKGLLLQNEPGQQKEQEDGQHQTGQKEQLIEAEIEGRVPDHLHDVFRHRQLPEIGGGQKEVREGDQHRGVEEDGPAPGMQGMADVQK